MLEITRYKDSSNITLYCEIQKARHIICNNLCFLKTLNVFFSVEVGKGRVVQGQNKRPIIQKPRPGPIPHGKLFTLLGVS